MLDGWIYIIIFMGLSNRVWILFDHNCVEYTILYPMYLGICFTTFLTNFQFRSRNQLKKKRKPNPKKEKPTMTSRWRMRMMRSLK